MLVYNSNYLYVNYLEIQNLLNIKFKNNCKKLSDNELKAEIFNFYDKMVKRKAKYFLIDTKNIEKFIIGDFINWFDNTILSLISSLKAKKIAWLFYDKQKKYTKFKKIIDDNIEQKIYYKPDEALKWLLKNHKRK